LLFLDDDDQMETVIGLTEFMLKATILSTHLTKR
jgi:hypothetical protein